MFLSRANEIVAGFVFADALKAEAAAVVSTLKSQGYTVHLISGDRVETVKSVAQQLGIVHYQGEMLPQDKLD